MKRVVALVAVLICCTSSAFAWSAESFVNGSVYEYEPVVDQPMLMSLAPAAAVADTGSDSLYKFVEHLPSINSSVPSLGLDYFMSVKNPVTGEVFEGDISTCYDVGISMNSYIGSSGSLNVNGSAGSFTVPENTSMYNYDDSTAYWPSWMIEDSEPYLQLDYDVSSLNGSAFYLAGTLRMGAMGRSSVQTSNRYAYASSVDLLFDGKSMQTLYSDGLDIDLGGLYFDFASPVNTVSLRFRFAEPLTFTGLNPGDTVSNLWLYLSYNSTGSISVLTDNALLDGFNDQAQNDINKHQSIESEWTGSMTQNFNALDLSGFTYPDGLIGAFALLTGIFNDFWNGMGEYNIVYVLPLTLGVVLLLIGRVSKFSDGSTTRGRDGDRPALPPPKRKR